MTTEYARNFQNEIDILSKEMMEMIADETGLNGSEDLVAKKKNCHSNYCNVSQCHHTEKNSPRLPLGDFQKWYIRFVPRRRLFCVYPKRENTLLTRSPLRRPDTRLKVISCLLKRREKKKYVG